ncbi:MAG: hypothetical protein JWM27_4209 [Gemmatimonadetes bacterium]|nr:hypothetical protein [Gemmatimonadota bacterium]
MTTIGTPPVATPHQYLVRERRAEYKAEYHDGEIHAMAGASRAHNRIVFRLVALLEPVLRERGCEGYAGDMRVRVGLRDAYFYPDVVVACGEPRFEDGETDTLLNPTLVVEVVSPSTERFDRAAKGEMYRRLPSLVQYVLVSQGERRVEWYTRQEGGMWLFARAEGPDAAVALDAVGCTLRLAELYEGVL